MSKKTLIILAVIAIFVIGGIAMLSAIGNSTPSAKQNTERAEIYYDYKIGDPITNYITVSEYPYVEQAGTGYVFIPVEIKIKNNDYSSSDKGFSPSGSDFDLKCSDGNKYDYSSLNTLNYSTSGKNIGNVNVTKGNTTTFTIIFKIPDTLTANEITWDRSFVSGYHDDSLLA